MLGGAWVIETEPFKDHRGKFARIFCQNELREIHHGKPIEQINYSITIQKGTVRGMHFQRSPKAEVRLVRCLKGTIFDVMVDLRHDSPTFLKWYGETLSAENMKMMYIPEGFAHGFQTLEENCEMLYLHTNFYSPGYEGGLRYDDPMVGIKWPLEVTGVSNRDGHHPLLNSDFTGITV
jgi:dTDP-4-dehydrorhamnose 3,5-epimerase